MNFSQKQQNTTLEVLDGLPPLKYLLVCRTEDQVNRWSEVRETFIWLKKAFQDYFSGEACEWPSEQKQDYYFALRDFYLSWYNCIQFNWEEIVASVAQQGLEIDQYASTPGQALIRFLEDSAAAFMQPVFLPYYRWTPHQTRNLAKLDRDVQKSLVKNQLNQKEQNLLKKYERDRKQTRVAFEQFFNFYENSVLVCSNSRNQSVKQAVKIHKKSKASLDALIQQEVHPSKAIRGHEYKNGIKKQMGSVGGI